MDSNMPMQNKPVNFFIGGGRYISDKFNMQIIDTSLPNAFDNLDLSTIIPDMVENYINSEPKEMAPPKPEEKQGGIFAAISGFFTANEEQEANVT